MPESAMARAMASSVMLSAGMGLMYFLLDRYATRCVLKRIPPRSALCTVETTVWTIHARLTTTAFTAKSRIIGTHFLRSFGAASCTAGMTYFSPKGLMERLMDSPRETVRANWILSVASIDIQPAGVGRRRAVSERKRAQRRRAARLSPRRDLPSVGRGGRGGLGRTEVELPKGLLGLLRVEGVGRDEGLVGEDLAGLELRERGAVARGGGVDGREGLVREDLGRLQGIVPAAQLEGLDGGDDGDVLAAEEAEDGAPDGGEEAGGSVFEDGDVCLQAVVGIVRRIVTGTVWGRYPWGACASAGVGEVTDERQRRNPGRNHPQAPRSGADSRADQELRRPQTEQPRARRAATPQELARSAQPKAHFAMQRSL